MAAFMIFHSNIKNEERFEAYASAVPATLKPYMGEAVINAKVANDYVGNQVSNNIGIIRFPDLRFAQDWYGSEKYQQLVPVRDQAAEMEITSYVESRLKSEKF